MVLGLLLWFSASFGLQDYQVGENTEYYYIHPPMFVEIELQAENEWLDIYGIYKNEIDDTDTIRYRPMQDYFIVGAELKLDNISFNIETMCEHPVANLLQPLQGEYGGYNRIFITVDSRREL